MSRDKDSSIEDILSAAGASGPQLLSDEVLVCPVCGKRTFRVRSFLYEASYFGKLLITTGECSSCGYKFRDVRLAEASEPKRIAVSVEGERQLRYLLVKSAASAVLIPERGYEMIPGPASMGFITTVEGILHRFREILEVACKGGDADEELCESERRWIERAIDGKERFTLVICDYEGGSAVKGEPEYVREGPLDKVCLEKKPEWLDRYIIRVDSGATQQ
ncbi:MAG: ZPR1 zinc finger domain-containing protein [Desulfurococcales archaeon]|nr:ZPR1 zinc finger domain-containing protein [Desulfurococcales archaeon]